MSEQSTTMDPDIDTYGVEQRGVDTIPDAERTARPRDIVGILFRSNLALTVMVFGWLAILYGLSWWQAVSAILVGTLVGSLVVMPLALLGYRAATNNSVSSGAYFGVRGRLVASVIGLLLCLGYLALTVWTGGEAVVSSLARATGSEETDAWLALGYAVIAIIVAVVAMYGFRWLVTLNKLIVPVVVITMILSIIAFAPDFDASYAGEPDLYALGEFWPTWLLAALTAGVAGPISYGHPHGRLDALRVTGTAWPRAGAVRHLAGRCSSGSRSRPSSARSSPLWRSTSSASSVDSSSTRPAGSCSRSSRPASSAASARAASTSTAWAWISTPSCRGSHARSRPWP